MYTWESVLQEELLNKSSWCDIYILSTHDEEKHAANYVLWTIHVVWTHLECFLEGYQYLLAQLFKLTNPSG